MRVLVAGWHGQVSIALSEAAARRIDITAYAVGRPAFDLTDHPSIGRGLFGIAPDIIINTAAYSDVEGAELDPAGAFRRNQLGSAALAEQAARIGVPIIHLSTVYVFNGVKQSPYIETDATAPINAYGQSKDAAESAVASANPKHIILRTGWIYSPFDRNFVTSILQRGASEATLQIDQAQRGSPTYAPNLAAAILDIAATATSSRNDECWGTFHIADQCFATWHELAKTTFDLASAAGDKSPEIQPVTQPIARQRARRPVNAMLDCTKLEATFGIRLPTWQTALGDCVKRIRSGGT